MEAGAPVQPRVPPSSSDAARCVRWGGRRTVAGRESERAESPATPILVLYRIETQRLFWYARQHRPADLRLDVGRVFNVYIGFLQVLASFRLCPCRQGKNAALFRGWHGTDPPSNFRLPREHARKPPNLGARFSFGESSSANRSGLRTTQAVHCRMSNVGVELSP